MKKSIMVDMDEVITDGGFLYLVNKYGNTNYTLDDIKNYYMQDLVENKEEFFKFFVTQNQYDYCRLLPNVVEVLKYLNAYYDIYIGTSYIIKEIPKECGIVLLQKHDFLYNNLPFISPEKYIFINNKSLLNCDVKIDDKLDNLKNAKIKLLFTAYHNKDLSEEYLKKLGVIRVNDWLEIKDILIKELNNESSSTTK